jgi:hypothetical protein
VHVAGVDLVRDEAGTFRVLEDNVRVPSGVSYGMENRRAMSHVLPKSPGRYVSGYLHPTPDAPVGETVVGQSHAWVEWFAGRWIGFDPTNGIPIGERHVVVGRGREYGDVPPLKGVYAGPPNTASGVEVRVTRRR